MSLHIAEPQRMEIALGQYEVWECEIIETESGAVVEKTRPCLDAVEAVQQAVRIRNRIAAQFPTPLPID